MDKSTVKSLFDVFESVITALVAVVLLISFILRIVTVSGYSMEPTLDDGDRVLISHLFFEPKTGDVVVLDSDEYPQTLIKRMIATEGQIVNIDSATGKVSVDGVELDEDYIAAAIDEDHMGDWDYPVTVPPGKVFVMGDNRNKSTDSRFITVGLIDERYVIGKVYLRLWPLNDIKVVK